MGSKPSKQAQLQLLSKSRITMFRMAERATEARENAERQCVVFFQKGDRANARLFGKLIVQKAQQADYYNQIGLQLACQKERLDNGEQLAEVFNILRSVMPDLLDNRVNPEEMLRLMHSMETYDEQNEVVNEMFVSGGQPIEEVEVAKVLERLEAVALDQTTLDLPSVASHPLPSVLPPPTPLQRTDPSNKK